MRGDLINEDSNQFGPGTDLVICLFALLMVFVIIVSYLYGNEKEANNKEKSKNGELANSVGRIEDGLKVCENEVKVCKEKSAALEKRGEFQLAGEFSVAGTFKQDPYDELRSVEKTKDEVRNIVNKYRNSNDEFPFIFVIGHANKVGLAGKPNQSEEERFMHNWKFAGERAVVIANLIQAYLTEEEKNKIIIVSTGEFDLKTPSDPEAPENAFVEVFFGNEWKPQSYKKSP